MDLRLTAENPDLGRLLESAPVCTFTLDAAGRFAGWSAGAADLTGHPPAEVVGTDVFLFNDGGPAHGLGGLWTLVRDGAPLAEGLIPVRRADGAVVYLLVALRRLEERDALVGAVGALTDLTLHLQSSQRHAQVVGSGRSSGLFQSMVGESPAMAGVFERIRQAAAIDVTVLIRGETGTGKELAARAIHALSPRAGCPLIGVNCSAIPDPLLESELFGHVKGAFTGAVRDKRGVFEEAQGGVLFLDEIGDLGPSVQVKLLRALQEREIRRVGGDRPIRIDVRIVSATHRDLAALVAAGTFREDLYYRLRVFELSMPPLRERPQDLRPLAEHFVSEFAARHRKRVVGLEPDAAARVEAYAWPGNVRELRNAIEHAFVTAPGERLRLQDLPPELQVLGRAAASTPTGPADPDRARIVEALERTGGRKAAAAQLLGISRVTLWKHMKRLGISPSYGAE